MSVVVLQQKTEKSLVARVPIEFHRKISISAAARDQSIQELIVKALESYLPEIRSEVRSELEKVA